MGAQKWQTADHSMHKSAGASIPWGNEAEILIIAILGEIILFAILAGEEIFGNFRGRNVSTWNIGGVTLLGKKCKIWYKLSKF